MIQKIKNYVGVARQRAQILAEARQILAELKGPAWANMAALPLGQLLNALLYIGLAHLKAAQAGQAAGNHLIAQVEARRAANLN